MKEGSVGEYRNVDEVFKHLETVFNDPNKTVNARRSDDVPQREQRYV